MKKINLQGMLNPLSEREMKNVVGGAMPICEPKEAPDEPPPLEEAACINVALLGECKMGWSGGERKGTCLMDAKTNRKTCKFMS